MEKKREEQECIPETTTMGDIYALRNSIRDNVWTDSSCILTEALNG